MKNPQQRVLYHDNSNSSRSFRDRQMMYNITRGIFMSRKVVITGRGLITPIGNGLAENLQSLKTTKSGIVAMPEWAEMGLDSRIAGKVNIPEDCPAFDRKQLRFMPANAQMAVAAAYEAITEAGYTMETLPGDRMAVINGCAGSAYGEVCGSVANYEKLRNLRRVSAFSVPRVMPSSAVSSLSLVYGIQGENYDISCACTSGAMAIIAGSRLIQSGEYDIVMVGGSEEVSWQQALGFNAMRALSHSYNDTPDKASRPFDKTRDGFVIAEGAGIVILESEEHAKKRGAVIHGVVTGYAANSNASDMVVPNVTASQAVMANALRNAKLDPADIGYINTHGTSTGIGDPVEMDAIRNVFGDAPVAINSTKSVTGHTIGAAGALEAIFCTMMLEHSFISATANLNEPEDAFLWADLVREPREKQFRHAISNSFGFGGANASLVISKYD